VQNQLLLADDHEKEHSKTIADLEEQVSETIKYRVRKQAEKARKSTQPTEEEEMQNTGQ